MAVMNKIMAEQLTLDEQVEVALAVADWRDNRDKAARKATKARLRALKRVLSDDWDGKATDDFAYLKPQDIHFVGMVEIIEKLESIDKSLKALRSMG